MTPADYKQDADYQRFDKTCEGSVVFKFDEQKLKTNRPKIDAVINDAVASPKNLKKYVLDSIKGFYEFAGNDKELLCAISNGYESAHKPGYIGRHNGLEQFTVYTYNFTGGAHGLGETTYYLFDENDHRLTLADILQGDKTALIPLLDAAYKAETKTAPADKNLDEYQRAWVKALHERTDNFYFSADGIVFAYRPYAVSSYADGQVELTLPYAKLHGIIKDAYLPQK